MFADRDDDKRAMLKAMFDYAAYRVCCGGKLEDELAKFISNWRGFDGEDHQAMIDALTWNNGRMPASFEWKGSIDG